MNQASNWVVDFASQRTFGRLLFGGSSVLLRSVWFDSSDFSRYFLGLTPAASLGRRGWAVPAACWVKVLDRYSGRASLRADLGWAGRARPFNSDYILLMVLALYFANSYRVRLSYSLVSA